VRALCVVFAALSLGACASSETLTTALAPEAAGSAVDWKIERRADRVSDVSTAVYVRTSGFDNAGWRFHNTILQLMCFKGEPIVRVAFDLKVGSSRSASVAYRFDDRPPREVAARFLNDYRTVIIEDRDEVARFAAEISTAEKVTIRISSLIAGQTSIGFRVRGGAAAIETAYADCPLQNDRMRGRRAA
jgi:hypothetical protein